MLISSDRPMDRSARTTRVLGIAGSLRTHSHNRALLHSAARVAPAGMSISVYDGLRSVPLFNEDLENELGLPPGVARLRDAIAASDGLLIATPEYNQSIPGVLKNAIDWLSRAPYGEGLAGVPVAIMGATTGPWGTRLAQASLRQILVATEALVLPNPTLFVRNAASRFDDERTLVDIETRTRVQDLLMAFGDWIQLVSPKTRRVDAI